MRRSLTALINYIYTMRTMDEVKVFINRIVIRTIYDENSITSFMCS
jgi:hypothetical protein